MHDALLAVDLWFVFGHTSLGMMGTLVGVRHVGRALEVALVDEPTVVTTLFEQVTRRHKDLVLIEVRLHLPGSVSGAHKVTPDPVWGLPATAGQRRTLFLKTDLLPYPEVQKSLGRVHFVIEDLVGITPQDANLWNQLWPSLFRL